ncbi:MAG: hypothetical protein CVV56_08025 [Tenericutes bacterium HGW-Tenericutes-1]|jgi:hypothetical protein|nr:MAG: hypothetical protein CVV56_08025 [Tenericutes bacterium HGW-Tenericutes-1]PKM95792.1 MAG: hypothetical protein CVU84_03055 [Firmicutes bacterium HGW-Firmicutes-1]
MEFNKLPMYDMSLRQFEDLCYDLLKANEEVEIVTRIKDDEGFDFEGEEKFSSGKSKSFLVVVKHWSKFNINGVAEALLRFITIENFDKLIFITSAKLTNTQHDEVKNLVEDIDRNIDFSIIDYNRILKLVNDNIEIHKKYFQNINLVIKKRYIYLSSSVLTIITSLLFISIQVLIVNNNKDSDKLDNRIVNVTESINSLHDLEEDLEGIRDDMIQMEIESQLIKEEYDSAKELEKITDDEIKAITYALNKKSFWQVIIQTIPGFLIGIASSVIGSIFYEAYKKRRQLSP